MGAMSRRRAVLLAACALLVGSTAAAAATPGKPGRIDGLRRVDVVADRPGVARTTDPDLVEPWGIVPRDGRVRVANHGTGTSTVYHAGGRRIDATITIPAARDTTGHGVPTGFTFNGSCNFMLTDPASGRVAPARFLFATEDGTIAGFSWEFRDTEAIVAVDSSAAGAVYTGLTHARTPAGQRLYAANFAAGRVEVFDEAFRMVTSFTDPALPAGFSPFNVRHIGGRIWVAFARQQSPSLAQPQPGAGTGVIEVFDWDGNFVRTFAGGAELDAPWAILRTPGRFGRLGQTILVGNAGSGQINAYDFVTGEFHGALTDGKGIPVAIEGLRGLSFGDPRYERELALDDDASPAELTAVDEACDGDAPPRLYFAGGAPGRGVLGFLVPGDGRGTPQALPRRGR